MKGAPDLVSGMESRTRDDAAGHGLAETQNVGHHTAMVAVKHGASSSETRLNFIQDQQCAAFRAEPASSRQIVFRRDVNASFALNGFQDQGCSLAVHSLFHGCDIAISHKGSFQ